MNTYLVIKDNTVINIVIWDGGSGWSAPEGTTTEVAPEGVGIGWTKSGSNWIAPEPVDPAPIAPTPENPNKINAIAKLAALGLTEAEIAALVK